jgi:hypothetical protein
MDVYGYVINGMDPNPIKHPEDSDLFSNPVEGTEHIDPKTGLMDWEIGASRRSRTADNHRRRNHRQTGGGEKIARRRSTGSVTERAMRAHHPSADKAIQDPRRARSGEGDH